MSLKNKILLLLLLVLIFFLNLGHFLENTDTPKKADLIVCLGGGYGARILKSIELYKNGYSLSNKMLLTGNNKYYFSGYKDLRLKYLKENNISISKSVVFNKKLTSTRNEIIFIQDYMILNNYSSAIIVSDNPHTARIKLLLNIFKKDNNLIFYVVGSNPDWWNDGQYYKSKMAISYVINESLKIVYTAVAYGILEPLGVLPIIKQYVSTPFFYIRKYIDRFSAKYTDKEKLVECK